MGSTTAEKDVASLVKQLRAVKASDLQDEVARKSLFEAARNVMFALESPGDSVQRIAYIVSLALQNSHFLLHADYHARV